MVSGSSIMHGIMHLHPGFEEEAYSCKDWEEIYVPAHIQMEGYDARSMPMSSIRGKP